MGSVEFEEDTFTVLKRPPPKPPRSVRFLMKIGLARNAREANFALLGIAGLFFLVSVFLILYFLYPPAAKSIPYQYVSPEMKNQLPQKTRMPLEKQE